MTGDSRKKIKENLMQWFIASTAGRLRGIMGAELYRVDGVPRVMSCGSRIVESNVGSFFFIR